MILIAAFVVLFLSQQARCQSSISCCSLILIKCSTVIKVTSFK